MDSILDAPANVHYMAMTILAILVLVYMFLMYSPMMAEFRENVLAYKNKMLLKLFVNPDGTILAPKEPSWLLSLVESSGLI